MVFVLVLQKQKQKAKNGRAVKVVRKVVVELVVQTCYGLNLPEEKGASGI
jgi:hypothetical protein